VTGGASTCGACLYAARACATDEACLFSARSCRKFGVRRRQGKQLPFARPPDTFSRYQGDVTAPAGCCVRSLGWTTNMNDDLRLSWEEQTGGIWLGIAF